MKITQKIIVEVSIIFPAIPVHWWKCTVCRTVKKTSGQSIKTHRHTGPKIELQQWFIVHYCWFCNLLWGGKDRTEWMEPNVCSDFFTFLLDWSVFVIVLCQDVIDPTIQKFSARLKIQPKLLWVENWLTTFHCRGRKEEEKLFPENRNKTRQISSCQEKV